jgi:primary-amine oxidase
LQEAYAAYGGADPLQRHTFYLDGGWGMGSVARPMMAGVDCPLNAVYLDIVYTLGEGYPQTLK